MGIHSDHTAPIQSSRIVDAERLDRAPLKTAQTGQGSFFTRLRVLPEARLFGGCIVVWLAYAAILMVMAP